MKRRTPHQGHGVYVIAEIGFNHGGDLDLDKKTIEAAARSGADAVKFQTFKAATMVSADPA
jgi:sialic acid synthase SpsE